MIARLISYQENDIGLIVAQPNWESTVTITLDLPTDIAKEPITFYESRRAFAESSRYTMKWTTYLSNAADAAELRIFLTRIRSEILAVPLWTDGCELLTSIPIGATSIQLRDVPVRWGTFWIIANSDFSTWEIVYGTLSAFIQNSTFNCGIGVRKAWPAGTIMYPLLWGRLEDRPKPESITDETMEVEITFKERSGFSLRLSTSSQFIPIVGGHIPRFIYTPLFNIQPNFSRPTDWTEMPDIIYEQVGFGRYDQQRAYDHRTPRGMEFEFYQATRDDISRIERFWRAQRGPVLRFMVPTWRGDMRMRADTPVPGQPRQIAIEDTEFTDPAREVQPGDPYIALIDQNNAIDPYLLSGTFQPPQNNPVANNSYLIASTNLNAHTATTTILSSLLLARFQEAKLEWEYLTPYFATTKIKFVELPHEYENTPPALPEPAYLFKFIEAGVAFYYFTSYENTIVITTGAWAGNWVPAPFSFDKIKTGLKLDQETLEFKSFKFDGNPLNKLWPFALDGLLTLYVVEVDAVHPSSSTAKVRFYGDVWSVDSDYKAKAIAFGNLFDRKFPRFLLMTSDNYVQFSDPTHITADAFKVTGTVAASNGQVITVSGAAAAQPDDYFAGGWMETPGVPGPNPSLERRGILHNSAGTFHIDRPLLKIQGGQQPVFNFYPGYDGSIDQCDTKFNNRINYGGHAYIPNVNPTIKAMKPQKVSGGKK
jgi:hypothetical protein